MRRGSLVKLPSITRRFMKTCASCKWYSYVPNAVFPYYQHKCLRESKKEESRDRVTGRVSYKELGTVFNAYTERYAVGEECCGEEGLWYECR